MGSWGAAPLLKTQEGMSYRREVQIRDAPGANE